MFVQSDAESVQETLELYPAFRRVAVVSLMRVCLRVCVFVCVCVWGGGGAGEFVLHGLATKF